MNGKTLVFNVSRKWYDLYRSGEKREEYRSRTEHWYRRLYDNVDKFNMSFKAFEFVEIRCGYPPRGGRPDTPNLRFRFAGIDYGHAEDGIGRELMGDKLVFVIRMEDIRETDSATKIK